MLETLTSNGLPVASSLSQFEQLRAYTGDLASKEVSDLYFEQGCVFLKDVLDRDLLLRLRDSYFAQFPADYFAPGTLPCEGVRSMEPERSKERYGVEGHPAWLTVRSQIFDLATDQSVMRQVARTILQEDVTPFRRRPLRHFAKGSDTASRAHVDASYIKVSPDRVVTFWVPVGACKLNSGGLVYLKNSHKADVSYLKENMLSHNDRSADGRPIASNLGKLVDFAQSRWLWSDFEVGDVVIHHPNIVHASVDCKTDYMRLSADVRYHATGAEVDPSWTQHWSADDGK